MAKPRSPTAVGGQHSGYHLGLQRAEPSGLEEGGHQRPAQDDVGEADRTDKEENPGEAGAQAVAQQLAAGFPVRLPGEIGKRRCCHRDAEQRDRQGLQQLGITQCRYTTRTGQRTELGIHDRGQLGHACSDHDRDPGAEHRSQLLIAMVEGKRKPLQQTSTGGQLDPDLEQATHQSAPRQRDGEIFRRGTGSPGRPAPERRDPGDVPDGGRRVRKKEAAMGVEDSKAPTRDHHEPGHREEDPDQTDRQIPSLRWKSEGDEVGDGRGQPNAQQGRHRRDGGQEPEGGAGQRAGRPGIAPLGGAGVDRDERGGERAFAQEIADQIGNLERGAKGVGRGRITEVVGEDPFPDEPEDPGEEDAGSHHRRRPGRPGARGQGFGGGSVGREADSSSRR